MIEPPRRALTRPPLANLVGARVLALAERRLAPAQLARFRGALWRLRLYLYVTPGEALKERALAGFPDEVRALASRCPLYRYDARGGGGFFPDRNEVWLAAGVETYEGLAQVALSACHELFHFVCHNHPLYRQDEDRGFAYLRRAVAQSRHFLDAYPRYRDWVVRSFLAQGDHANPVEFFADIPTNFRDPHELPPPLRAHFGPLIDASPFVVDLGREPEWAIAPEDHALATFQRMLAPA